MVQVSIIIPTYNRAGLLHSAIASVLNQTFHDFEIVVVDDGSEDNTREIVMGFHDKRIKYIRHMINKGEASTRNTGIMNSNAQYIAFLDDDDEWLQEKLRLQVNLFKNSPPGVGGVYSGFVVIDMNDKSILGQKIPRKRGNIYHDIFVENCIGTPSTVIVRKECFERVGLFDESIAYGLDYDMWIRISKEFHFEYIEEPLVKYYVHENRLSNNPEIRIRGLETILHKYSRFFAFNSKRYSRSYLSLGLLCCYSGKIRKGIKAFINAIRLYPFEPRNYFNLGLSLLGAKNFRRVKEFRNKEFREKILQTFL